jgi:antitoxin MazE
MYLQGGKPVRAQVLKWGNSLAVRIPKAIAEKARLKEGDPLELEVAEDEGAVHLQRVGRLPTLTELVGQITSQNRYPEISSGPEMGKEAVEW